MDPARTAAELALSDTVDLLADTGLVEALRALVQDVHAGNLDRFEPDELGDTALSFGIQSSENLKQRALRRFRHDDLEAPEAHWDIPGLAVWTPRNSLRLEIGGRRISTMKAPYAEGRRPRWELARNWAQDSEIRSDMATANSRVLGGYSTHFDADSGLFPHPARAGLIRDYLFVWAGEAEAAMTAGWLTIPALGEAPFVAIRKLWWDDEQTVPPGRRRKPSPGDAFDQRTPAEPEVIVRPRPAEEGRA